MTLLGLVAPILRRPAWVAVAVAGGFAGTLAVAVQVLVWSMQSADPLQRLLRDARLTAALVMGKKILSFSPQWRWDVLVTATLIHYALSVAYAALAFAFVRRVPAACALIGGGLYGLLLYAVNLHALTVFFPWFSIARGWDTLVVHVAFGIALTGVCGTLRSLQDRGLGTT